VTEERWAKIPASIIESDLDAGCKELYSWLDLKQGSRDHAHRGIRAAADSLGRKPETIRLHAKHLMERHLIELVEDEGHGRSTIRLIHQPARGVVNWGVRLGKPTPSARGRSSPPVGQKPAQGSDVAVEEVGQKPAHRSVPAAASRKRPTPLPETGPQGCPENGPQVGGFSEVSEEGGFSEDARFCARCGAPAWWYCFLVSRREELRCGKCRRLGDVESAGDVRVHGYPDDPFTDGGVVSSGWREPTAFDLSDWVAGPDKTVDHYGLRVMFTEERWYRLGDRHVDLEELKAAVNPPAATEWVVHDRAVQLVVRTFDAVVVGESRRAG
jgi:ribosomal protein S27AE